MELREDLAFPASVRGPVWPFVRVAAVAKSSFVIQGEPFTLA